MLSPPTLVAYLKDACGVVLHFVYFSLIIQPFIKINVTVCIIKSIPSCHKAYVMTVM